MRRKAFRPADLDGLESRIALSAVGAAGAAEVVRMDSHHEHTVKTEHHPKTEHVHVSHERHATK